MSNEKTEDLVFKLTHNQSMEVDENNNRISINVSYICEGEDNIYDIYIDITKSGDNVYYHFYSDLISSENIDNQNDNEYYLIN